MSYGHLRADCLYTAISSGPNARYRVWEAFTFFTTIKTTSVGDWRGCLAGDTDGLVGWPVCDAER